MTEIKKRNVGSGIGIGAALGVAFGAIYGSKSGDMYKSIALGIAIGVAIGAIFDFAIRKKEWHGKDIRNHKQACCKYEEDKIVFWKKLKYALLQPKWNQAWK